MSHCHCLQIKSCIKLNNNEATPKRGKERYNQAKKLDFDCRTLVHNVIALKQEACIDLTGDLKRWGNQGWGEPQSGMARKILNRPGVYKRG